MSFDLDDADTREDVRRIAAASERFAESEEKLVSMLAVPTAEQLRQQRHHDVLCLVLKAQAELETRHDTLSENADACVSCAKRWADLAYPPSKAEP